MKKEKINGYAKWVLVSLAVLSHLLMMSGILYKQAAMDAILGNDVKHLQKDMTEIKKDIGKINDRLWESKK